MLTASSKAQFVLFSKQIFYIDFFCPLKFKLNQIFPAFTCHLFAIKKLFLTHYLILYFIFQVVDK